MDQTPEITSLGWYNDQIIWRGFRFWVQTPQAASNLARGWNTSFLPYRIVSVTAKQIKVCAIVPPLTVFWLNRNSLEHFGKVYHSRVSEYFYADKPLQDPEHKFLSDSQNWHEKIAQQLQKSGTTL